MDSTISTWPKLSQASNELHVGLPVPRYVAKQIHDWARKQPWPEGTQLEHPTNHHITLLYTPEGHEHKDAGWLKHLDQAKVRFDGLHAFPADEMGHAYVLGVDSPEIEQHANELQQRAKWMGLPVPEYDGGFKPHITLGYGPDPRPPKAEIPNWEFDVGPSEVSPTRPEATAKVAGVTLYRGEGDHDRPSYYPMSGPDAQAGWWWTDDPQKAANYAVSTTNGKVYKIDVEPHEFEPRGMTGNYVIPDPAVRTRRVEYNPGTTAKVADTWQPGQWGKGFTINGQPHTWPVGDPMVQGGSPHHWEIHDQMFPNYEESRRNPYKDPAVISPEGWYTVNLDDAPEEGDWPEWTQAPSDPTAFARHMPGLKYVADPAKWERRITHNHNAVTPLRVSSSYPTSELPQYWREVDPIPGENVGIRADNNPPGTPFRPSEFLGHHAHGGRGTGAFGTGLYFVSHPDSLEGHGRKYLRGVDLTGYNLYKPRSVEEAHNFHNDLRTLNDLAKVGKYEDTYDYFGPVTQSIGSLYHLPYWWSEEGQQAMRDAIDTHHADVQAGWQDRTRWNQDTAATRFMRTMGYDGVDVRHLSQDDAGLMNLDNMKFGSVVYRPQDMPHDVGDFAPVQPKTVARVSAFVPLYHWMDRSALHKWMDPSHTGPGETWLTEMGDDPNDAWNPDIPQMEHPVRLTIDPAHLDHDKFDPHWSGWQNNHLYKGIIPPEAVTEIKSFKAPEDWYNTMPSPVNAPDDHWPEYGEVPPDEKQHRNLVTDPDFAYDRTGAAHDVPLMPKGRDVYEIAQRVEQAYPELPAIEGYYRGDQHAWNQGSNGAIYDALLGQFLKPGDWGFAHYVPMYRGRKNAYNRMPGRPTGKTAALPDEWNEGWTAPRTPEPHHNADPQEQYQSLINQGYSAQNAIDWILKRHPKPAPGRDIYHVAPTTERDRIRQHGLMPTDPEYGQWFDPSVWNYWHGEEEPPTGVYGWPDPESAKRYQQRLLEDQGYPSDVWRVPNVRPLADPDFAEGESSYVPHRVDAPELYKRLEDRYADYYDPAEDQVFNRTGQIEHQLWWKPGDWGRGLVHPNGTVYTWPEAEAEHDQRSISLRIPPDPMRYFGIRPDGSFFMYDSDTDHDLAMMENHVGDMTGLIKTADYYHFAPTVDRERVRQHGLQPSWPGANPRWEDPNGDTMEHQPVGVYAEEGYPWENDQVDPKEVAAEGLWNYPNPQNWDLWRIPHNQVSEVYPDPHGGETSRRIPHVVHPELYEGGPEEYGWPQKQADYYHVAPTYDRARIQQHGLQPSWPARNDRWYIGTTPPSWAKRQPEAVYLTDSDKFRRWRDTLPDWAGSKNAENDPEGTGGYQWGESYDLPERHQWDVWRVPEEQIKEKLEDRFIPQAVAVPHVVYPELHEGGPETWGPWPERQK